MEMIRGHYAHGIWAFLLQHDLELLVDRPYRLVFPFNRIRSLRIRVADDELLYFGVGRQGAHEVAPQAQLLSRYPPVLTLQIERILFWIQTASLGVKRRVKLSDDRSNKKGKVTDGRAL